MNSDGSFAHIGAEPESNSWAAAHSKAQCSAPQEQQRWTSCTAAAAGDVEAAAAAAAATKAARGSLTAAAAAAAAVRTPSANTGTHALFCLLHAQLHVSVMLFVMCMHRRHVFDRVSVDICHPQFMHVWQIHGFPAHGVRPPPGGMPGQVCYTICRDW